MVDAVLVVDASGQITATNTAAERMTGYARVALRGMAYGRLMLDESSGVRTAARRSAAGHDPPPAQQSWLVTADGTRIPVSVTGSPVLAPDGQLEQIVVVARDVRELRQILAEKDAELHGRRAAERELRALNASVEERLDETRASLLLAERRATLGTLAGGVGHELRNIAQVQTSAVEALRAVLADGGDIAAMVREVLPDLTRATAHITDHGERLLQLARPGPDLVDEISVRHVVDGVLAMMRGAGKLRHVRVDIAMGDDPALTVMASRTRIEQILVNLVVNAIDAIGTAGGTVTITAALDADRQRVVCEVRDTGPGIPAADLDRVFQPFFTTKPPDQGTGLGLSVAREIVHSYGGTLVVTSALGHGATFRFDLPRPDRATSPG